MAESLEQRIKRLEGYVREQKPWKEKCEQLERQFADIRTKIYNELKGEFDEERKGLETERNELLGRIDKLEKDLGQFKAEHEALENLRKLLIPEAGAYAPVGPSKTTIGLEHKELVVNIHHAGEIEVEMKTTTKEGQMMYCIVNEMPREGWMEIELIKKLLERGWNVKQSTVNVTLRKWAAEGLLIRTEKGYRLPSKVKFNIEKE